MERSGGGGGGGLLIRPAISVVVCTRDRPAALARCLAALARLDYAPFEVLVVDNAPRNSVTATTAETAETAEIVDIVAAGGHRYVREERPGLDRARNRGAALARHDIVAYTDDDCEPDPGWLAALAAAFADHRIAGVTGRVLPAAVETPAQRLFESYGGGMDKGGAVRELRWDRLSAFERIAVQAVGVGANMAFRRSALMTVAGFDPALDLGTPARGAGDLDIFHRLLRAGCVLRYEPAALVRHHHRREMPQLRRQLRDNGRSFGVYLLKLWREGDVTMRGAVAAYALLRWAPWLAARVVRGALGLHKLPLPLLWDELAGALSAPRAWAEVRRAGRPPAGY